LRFTSPAPLSLLYYNNYGGVKCLWSRAGKSNPVTAIGESLKGAKRIGHAVSRLCPHGTFLEP